MCLGIEHHIIILSRNGFYSVALWFLYCRAMVSSMWCYGFFTVALWFLYCCAVAQYCRLWFLYCGAMVSLLLRYGFYIVGYGSYTVALWFLYCCAMVSLLSRCGFYLHFILVLFAMSLSAHS